MITVHHLENSRSQRILWLLEELEFDYEIKHYARDANTLLAPPALKTVHQLGKSPVITDDARTVAESGAIIEYLVHKSGGRLAPVPGSEARLRYTYWLHYAEGTLMPLLVMKLIFGRLGRPPMPLPLRPFGRIIAYGVQRNFLDPRLAENLAYVDAELNRIEWLCGDEFTAADIMMSYPLEAAAGRVGLKSRYPRLATFLERIHARPAYRRALERGGPFDRLN